MKKSHESAFNADMARLAYVSNLNHIWEKATHLATPLSYPKNAIIPHSEQQGVYFIQEGAVVLSYIAPGGRERISLSYGKSSIFNEARAFADNDVLGFFTCTTDTSLFFFPKDLLLHPSFIQEYPDLIKNLLSSMGSKILLHYVYLSEMGTGSGLSHLCRFIVSLSVENGGRHVFPAKRTQQEVCNILGIHRATLARMIKKLKEMGVISSFKERNVTIEDYDLLVELSLDR